MKRSYFFNLYLILFGICLWCIVAGQYLLPFKYSFPYVEDFLSKQGPWWLWPLANFDGVHYLLLAKEGYVRDLYQAFFPVYPLLVRALTTIVRNSLVASLFISHGCFLVMAGAFYRLVRIDFNQETARRSLLSLVFFPTSFFLLGTYSESLFLALTFGFFIALRRKKYFPAAILAGIASATRLVGLLLAVPLLYEFWEAVKVKSLSKYSQAIGLSFVAASGFLLYIRFLNDRFSDPFKFMHVQGAFGAERTSDKVVLIYQVFYRYLKMIFTVDRTNPIYYTVWLELAVSLLFLGLLLAAIFYHKLKIRLSYGLFSIMAYLIPTLTGTFSSMPRYVLACMAGFMVLGQVKNKRLFGLMIAVSSVVLIINAIRFYRGYWIA